MPDPSQSGPIPLVIGWKEHVAFPEWGIARLRAKIDTGACSSALDAAGYEIFETDGGPRIRLELALRRHHQRRLKVVEAPVREMVVVRNSGGIEEQRPVIDVLLELGPVARRIRLTVTNRAAMRYRMILGRQALAGAFVVDVSRTYLLG